MEFEFDKEIDSLLRQSAKGDILFPKQNTPAEHIDADEISMFAESALPEKAKPRVMKHLADCDRCRTILSNTVLLNAEAGNETAVVPVQETKAETVVASTEPSWFEKLFSTKNLAFGMGALALLFAVGIGFFAIQNLNNGSREMAKAPTNASNTTADKASEDELAQSIGEESKDSNSNSIETETGSTLNEVDKDSDTATTNNKQQEDNKLAEPSDRKRTAKNEVFEDSEELDEDNNVAKPKRTPVMRATPKGKIARNQPKPKPVKDILTTESADKADLKDEAKPSSASSRQDDGVRKQPRKSAPPPAPITSRRGATRAKKRAKEREYSRSEKLLSKSATKKKVSGKTFNRKGRVWYDSAYKGQRTTNVRRNTSQYRKLDSGLRSIANKLSGTVVVIWKSKAYRIQ